MSGGIDSTMAALILLEAGHSVTGITMAIWDETIPLTESTKSGCFGPGEVDDLKAAKKACEKLGIEHRIIYLKDEFKDNVLSYFCKTYIAGETPNPCLLCNQRMKFGLLPQRAKEQGLDFDLFATGHYVRSAYDPKSKRYQLSRAVDLSKDQSYFLSFLSQEQLKNSIFPLGSIAKNDIRALAVKHGFEELIVKQESQDFLETDDYSILFEDGSFTGGEIVDIDGKVLGKHRGLIHYTIGQRKNLGIPGQIEAFYVLEIDAAANRIVVGPKEYLYRRDLIAEGVNWVSIPCPLSDMNISAKIRLQHDPAPCTISPMADASVKVSFVDAQLSITPGQAVVFYDGDLLLGGGFIRK